MEKHELATKKQYVFKGKIIRVRNDEVLLPNNNAATREVVEHPGGVCVLPIDDDDNVYFVSQFRYPFEDETLEIPAGKIEAGEQPLTTARRELKEETGFTAEKMIFLGEFPSSPGYTTEVFHIFVARGLVQTGCEPEEDEFLEVVKMPWCDALELIGRNEICDSKTVIAFLMAERFHNTAICHHIKPQEI